MGGRGSSNPGMKATNARDINNMNEAQIDKEIKKAERQLQSAKRQYEKNIGESASSQAMRGAFPLGAGGLTKGDAERYVSKVSKRELTRSKNVVEASQKMEDAQKRIERLQAAKTKIKGTNKTVSQLEKEKAEQRSKSTQTTMKWSTTQKSERTANGGLKPRIIKSGDYEIRGSSILRVTYSGKEIGVASNLKAAKELAENHKKRRK